MATFNLADLFELVADAAQDREAVVTATRRLSYTELDRRANRLAHHLADAGVGPGDHVGLQLVNGTEYLEGMLACFKIRAVPVNVNYRYVEEELARLFDDADLVALVYHRQFSARVAHVAPGLPALRHLVVVDDGTDGPDEAGGLGYEAALAAARDDRPSGTGRTADDRYIAYTGGTTGMPKGVLWRHEDIFFAAMGGGDPFQLGDFIERPEQIAERLPETGAVSLQTPPLMHVSAQWGAFGTLFGGGKVVFPPPGHFDAATIWRLVEDERVNIMTIVGDAMATPLADAFEAATAAGTPPDVSMLFAIGSGGATLSPSSKARLASLLPAVILIDGYGSTETGIVGTSTAGAGSPADRLRFTPDDRTTVLEDDGHPVAPGSGVVGHLARRGHMPLGYHKDPAKTAATFVVVDGVRWALPGDMATIDADGAIVLLGRGSTSINTGGEKVYCEEVESVLRGHPAIADAVVVGIPDPKWGERVVAVVRATAGATPAPPEVDAYCHEHLASYKVPRDLVLVDEVVRSPAGKPDYRWAKDVAITALG